MSRHWLEPDWTPGLIIPDLPIKYFQDRGIKALLLDVDSTLLHGKGVTLHKSVKDWVLEARQNLKVHLLSNNPSKRRISAVADQLGITYTCSAAKPRRKALRKILKKMNLDPEQIAIIGDRIFTDVLAGNRLGLYTVLVRPLGPDGLPDQNDKVQRLEQKLSELLGANQR